MNEFYLSFTEENYLKSLIHLTLFSKDKNEVGTNELATNLSVKPATVNDMLKKLKEKNLVDYKKYGKISLTESGRLFGMNVIRKHRLWETFLVEKLSFSWDEVHEVAEQLEHIQSSKLVDSLEALLEYPKYDPHGDPIPNAKGEIELTLRITLDEMNVMSTNKVVAVKDNSSEFLQYVNRLNLKIGDEIHLISKESYDDLLTIEIHGKQHVVSQKFAQNIFVLQ
jgi:DtxR family Mn-dependent transcriptional regulator